MRTYLPTLSLPTLVLGSADTVESNSNLAATCTKNTIKSDEKVGLITAADLWEGTGQEQGMQNAQKDAAALGVIFTWNFSPIFVVRTPLSPD